LLSSAFAVTLTMLFCLLLPFLTTVLALEFVENIDDTTFALGT